MCKALPSRALSRETEGAVEEDIRGRSKWHKQRHRDRQEEDVCGGEKSHGSGMGLTRLWENFQRIRSVKQ